MSIEKEFCFKLNLEKELRNERFFEVKKNNKRLFWKEGREKASITVMESDTKSTIWENKTKGITDNKKED